MNKPHRPGAILDHFAVAAAAPVRTKGKMTLSSDEIDRTKEPSVAADDAGSSSAITARRIFKVLRDPRLATALLNAQFNLRRKTHLPLSVRLVGRILCTAGGSVEFGNGVCLVGSVVPIEIVSHKGSHVSIGDHTFINYGVSITSYERVKIGRHCLLGHHLRIVDRNECNLLDDQLPASPVTIEDHVWVGAHVIILPGVCIGRNSAIGAGSIVTRDIPANCLAVGNPARVVRQI